MSLMLSRSVFVAQPGAEKKKKLGPEIEETPIWWATK